MNAMWDCGIINTKEKKHAFVSPRLPFRLQIKEEERKKETVCFTVNLAFQSLRNSKGVFFYKIKDSWQPNQALSNS